MKMLILVLLVLLVGAAIWGGYVYVSSAGDTNDPGITVKVNKEKVGALEQKAKDALHKETAPKTP